MFVLVGPLMVKSPPTWRAVVLVVVRPFSVAVLHPERTELVMLVEEEVVLSAPTTQVGPNWFVMAGLLMLKAPPTWRLLVVVAPLPLSVAVPSTHRCWNWFGLVEAAAVEKLRTT